MSINSDLDRCNEVEGLLNELGSILSQIKYITGNRLSRLLEVETAVVALNVEYEARSGKFRGAKLCKGGNCDGMQD